MNAEADRKFFIGAGRALGGATIFALPMLMTKEMWELGGHLDPHRIVVLLLATLPMLVFLSAYSGFEETSQLFHDVVDAFVAIALAGIAAAAVLALIAVFRPGVSQREWLGMLALQIVPASIGALLAQSQLGADGKDGNAEIDHDDPGYLAELGLMAAGALFLGFNIAPTEEVLLIATQMTDVHMLLLVSVSVLVMHGFVFAVEFRGHHAGKSSGALFRFSVPGYCIAFMVSAFVLWSFGRFDGASVDEWMRLSVVLAFPSAIGAAAARLVL